MAPIPGSVRVAGFIAPTDSSDVYAVTDSQYNKGGYREVATLIERDAITNERRRIGMMVYVQSEDKSYYLKDGIGNINWTEFVSGGIVPVNRGGTGLSSVDSGKLLFGNTSTELATSNSLIYDIVKRQLLTPKLVLTNESLGTVESGKLEFSSSKLYFSIDNTNRYNILLNNIPDNQNITLGTLTGTQIATSPLQKLGFFGVAPIVQPNSWQAVNGSDLRSFNTKELTMDDVGNILGTIINDLKLLGLFG